MKLTRILWVLVATTVLATPTTGAEAPQGLARIAALSSSGAYLEAHMRITGNGRELRETLAAGAVSVEAAARSLGDGLYSYRVEFVSAQLNADLATLEQLRAAGDRAGYSLMSELIQKTEYGVIRSGWLRVAAGTVEEYSTEVADREDRLAKSLRREQR